MERYSNIKVSALETPSWFDTYKPYESIRAFLDGVGIKNLIKTLDLEVDFQGHDPDEYLMTLPQARELIDEADEDTREWVSRFQREQSLEKLDERKKKLLAEWENQLEIYNKYPNNTLAEAFWAEAELMNMDYAQEMAESEEPERDWDAIRKENLEMYSELEPKEADFVGYSRHMGFEPDREFEENPHPEEEGY